MTSFDQSRKIDQKLSFNSDAILRALPDLIFVYNEKGEYITYHAPDQDDLMVAPEKFLGKKVCDVLPDKAGEKVMKAITAAKSTGKIQVIRYDLPFQEGIRHYESSIVPAGKDMFLAVSRNISEQVKLQEQLQFAEQQAVQANQFKSYLLQRLATEIKTSLSGITGMADMLDKTDLDDEQKGFLNIVNISSNNVHSLISNILDYSRIESDDLEIITETFEPGAILRKVARLLDLKSHKKDVEIELNIAEEIPAKLKGDPARFRQVLINLTDNAYKYTQSGKITINANFDRISTRHGMLQVEIIDTGQGISPEKIEEIQNSPYLAHGSERQTHGGLGLGLIISKYLVVNMGGEIRLESSPGKGSKVWFAIKLDLPEDAERTDRSRAGELQHKEASGNNRLSVLLVEDNLLNQKLATAILNKKGHLVDVAENGKVGVEKFKTKKYDVVLMDIQMPVMDGIEASKLIRKMEKNGTANKKHGVPIIAVTAYVMEQDKQKLFDAGINEYLHKPYKSRDLLGLINNSLAK